MDPDDRLSDVADDREQILASFEDGEGAHLHGGGDGASGSSVGTGSPDIFHVSLTVPSKKCLVCTYISYVNDIPNEFYRIIRNFRSVLR